MRVVVFGPRTRLAQALLRGQWSGPGEVFLVARNPDEARELAVSHPGATIVRRWEPSAPASGPDVRVAIVCCALGVIHPVRPVPDSDLEETRRDLSALEALTRTCEPARLHVVFVSSVLALSLRRGREYYTGWKCMVEGSIARILEGLPGSKLSVVYPGRLVADSSHASLRAWIHSTYTRLAAILVRIIEADTPRRTVVGLDARMWLLARLIHDLRRALTGLM